MPFYRGNTKGGNERTMPVNDYDKISRAFEKTVIKLRDNLQYLANEGKVSDRFLTIQNLIIKTLINYQHQIEALLSDLEWENTELLLSQSKQGQQLRENIEALESICMYTRCYRLPALVSHGNTRLNTGSRLFTKAGHDNLTL